MLFCAGELFAERLNEAVNKGAKWASVESSIVNTGRKRAREKWRRQREQAAGAKGAQKSTYSATWAEKQAAHQV